MNPYLNKILYSKILFCKSSIAINDKIFHLTIESPLRKIDLKMHRNDLKYNLSFSKLNVSIWTLYLFCFTALFFAIFIRQKNKDQIDYLIIGSLILFTTIWFVLYFTKYRTVGKLQIANDEEIGIYISEKNFNKVLKIINEDE